MDTLQAINSRRSIRRYLSKQIEESSLQEILNSVINAPSGKNQQLWHFTVIQNGMLLDKMVDIIKDNIQNSDIEFMKEKASDPNYHTFYKAPTVIIISADDTANSIQVDCGTAAQTICLAAESMEIGSCIIGSSALLFMSERRTQVKEELGMPSDYNHICSVALGYIDGEKPLAPDKNKNVFNFVR